MSDLFEHRLAIPGTYNIRDLGGYPCADGQTQWRRMLRADSLHRVQPDGVAQLVETGVQTVIDLRHGHELEDAPNPFRDHPQVRYVVISLFDQLVPPGISGAGGERRSDMLLGLFCMALAERQAAIREALTAIATARSGIVLFHCSGGKDRTGIIAALILAVAGVAPELIVEDFALTKVMIAPMIEEILAEATARGKDVTSWGPFLGSEPETMRGMLDHIDEEYGGVSAYLARIEMEPNDVERLRLRLVGVAPEVASI